MTLVWGTCLTYFMTGLYYTGCLPLLETGDSKVVLIRSDSSDLGSLDFKFHN